MIDQLTLAERVKDAFLTRIQTKTGWGKVELHNLYIDIYIEQLEKLTKELTKELTA